MDDLYTHAEDKINEKSFTIVKANKVTITNDISDINKLCTNLMKAKLIKKLDFTAYLSVDSLEPVFNLLKYLPYLQELSFDYIDAHGFQRLTEVLTQSTFSILKLHSFEQLKGVRNFSYGLMNTTSLKVLSINAHFGCYDEFSALILAVAKSRSITDLNLTSYAMKIVAADLRELVSSSKLKYLAMGGINCAPNNEDQITEGLISASILESLTWSTMPTEELTRALFDGIKLNTSLKTLDLSTIRNPTQICDVLKVNRTLTDVQIMGDYVPMDVYCEILVQNKSLKRLQVPLAASERYDSTNISNSLKVNKTITSLQLDNLIFRPYGIFINSLLMNQSLTELDIHAQELSLDEYRMLYTALKEDSHLQRLTFGDFVELPAEVFSEFADVIQTNRVLRYVYVYGRGMSIDAAKKICQALKENDTLTILHHWWRHQIQLEDDNILQDMLTVNRSLTELNFFFDTDCRSVCSKNKEYQSTMITNTIVIIHNLARSRSAFDTFPREVWIEIFTRLRYPGTSYFGDVAKKIFDGYGTK